MKEFLAILSFAVLVLAEGSAWAGVVGSPHDIAAQKYVVLGREEEKRNVCNYCHVPHKAKGARLWPTAPPSLSGWGKVGPLCYSCHDGVAIVSPYVDASNTAFNPKSHGLKLSELPPGDDASGSGLPYTRDNDQGSMECSTCHNPHDNTIRPFLRAPLAELCGKCHKNRTNSGIGVNNAESTHPVNVPPRDETGGPSPVDPRDEFKVEYPGEYPTENGKYTEGVHWTLGGHLSGGKEGLVACTTCHAPHGVEVTGPPGGKLLAMDPKKENADLFCEGCHAGKRADNAASPPFPNPGGTDGPRTYHAADNDKCNGEGRIVEVTQPEGWEFGKGGEVLCTTCHKPHGALKGSPILRPPVNSDTFCESCHNKPFGHHPTGSLLDNNHVNSGKPLSRTRQIVIPPDFPAGITYGNPGAGTVYCSTCHKAHNAYCPPVLVIDCTKGNSCDICTLCHPKFNPTWQTNDSYKGTHFMGDPTQAVIDKVTVTGTVFGTQPGYFDQYPPLNRTTWPESHLLSKYGGPQQTDVGCCSCHGFEAGGITAGEADQSPYLGPILAPDYQPDDLTSGLLARAGGFKEWLDSDVFQYQAGGDRGTMQKVDKYLCTGCHGLTPNSHPDAHGEGMTHPMMGADGSAFTPRATASVTFNKHVNCESCHKPHEADSTGGFLILRKVYPFGISSSVATTVPDPYRIVSRKEIEFAPLCQLCHIGY